MMTAEARPAERGIRLSVPGSSDPACAFSYIQLTDMISIWCVSRTAR